MEGEPGRAAAAAAAEGEEDEGAGAEAEATARVMVLRRRRAGAGHRAWLGRLLPLACLKKTLLELKLRHEVEGAEEEHSAATPRGLGASHVGPCGRKPPAGRTPSGPDDATCSLVCNYQCWGADNKRCPGKYTSECSAAQGLRTPRLKLVCGQPDKKTQKADVKTPNRRCRATTY